MYNYDKRAAGERLEMNRWDLWTRWILFILCQTQLCYAHLPSVLSAIHILISMCKTHSQQLEHVTEGVSCTN